MNIDFLKEEKKILLFISSVVFTFIMVNNQFLLRLPKTSGDKIISVDVEVIGFTMKEIYWGIHTFFLTL